MPEPLDPSKCEPGTKGFLPQSTVYDYEGWGEGESVFDAFKEPTLTLNENHQWVNVRGDIMPPDTRVFATWQDAVRHTVQRGLEDFKAVLREAQADLAQAAKVERWLLESDGACIVADDPKCPPPVQFEFDTVNKKFDAIIYASDELLADEESLIAMTVAAMRATLGELKAKQFTPQATIAGFPVVVNNSLKAVTIDESTALGTGKLRIEPTE